MEKMGLDPQPIEAIVLSHIHGDHTDGLQPYHLAVLGDDAGGPASVDEADVLFGGFLEFEGRGRHLFFGLE